MRMILKAVMGGFFSLPVLGYAQCETEPSMPTMLQESEVNESQLKQLGSLMDTYFQNVDSYKVCVDNKISRLERPEGNPSDESYFDSPDYQAYQMQFDTLVQKIDQLEIEKSTTIDRFNFHVENVVPDNVD